LGEDICNPKVLALFAFGAAIVGTPILRLFFICCASSCAVFATGISWAIAPSFL
jgi:hypothetical protein